MRSSSRSTRARRRSSGSSSRGRSSSRVIRRQSRVTKPPGPVSTLSVLSVRAAHLPRARRRRRARVRLLWQWSLFLAAVLVLGGTTLGLAFAGSPERLPAGSEIAGIDVSGLTAAEARAMLKQRSRELGRVPVVFTADGKRWRVKPDAVVADVDWAAAVEAAREQGEGFGPIRGLKRL